MCGRVTLTKDDVDEIAGMLDAELSPEDARRYKRHFNVAPSDLHWIVEYGADRRVLAPATWGYVPTAPRRTRAEAAHQRARRAGRVGTRVSRGVRVAALRGRHRQIGRMEHRPRPVLVPPPRRRPDPDGRPLIRIPPAGQHDPRFTILTTRPNKLVAQIHDRMPVILPAARIDDWLTAPPADAADLIRPAPDEALIATPVSRRVNSVANDDAACLGPPETDAQRSLF